MTAPVPPQTARFERKREAILETAARLFNARGLSGATLSDVAQGVGLTTASVTYYYRKKEDLAAACLLRAIETLDALVSEAWTAPSPPERLTDLVSRYFVRLADAAEGRAPALITFSDLRALTGPQAAAVMEAFIALYRRVRELFQDPAGPAFTRTEQNARAHLVFSALIRAQAWTERYETGDYPRAAARAADILLNGMAGEGRRWAPLALDIAPPVSGEGGEVSREAFLRAATGLVNDHGYRGASVDRISAKLHVTKGSFYHHNETKDDLVAACFRHTFDVMRRAHNEALAAADDGWTRLCAFAAALVRYQLSARGPLLRVSALSATAEALRPSLMADLRRLSAKTAGVVADGIADGSLRAVDPVIAADLLLGLTNAGVELDKWAPGATLETAPDLFVKPLMTGVFAPA
jgi:AcrR family transcriptional regulator